MPVIQTQSVNSLRLMSWLPDLDALAELESALDALARDAGATGESCGMPAYLKHTRCNDFSEVLSLLDESSEVFPNLILISISALAPKIKEHLDQIIKRLDGRYVPLVLLGEGCSSEDLIEALENGANDYVVLPADPLLIKVKLQAQLRVANMHSIMSEQHREISNNHKHILREQQMAKEVFNKVAHDSIELDNITHWLSPIAVFNGDILLATPTPSGSLLVLMGDFTGHGLGAAIGTIPLASTFYGMASKGFAMYDIINELNSKLNALLPTGVFCCACVAQINFKNGIAEVWNAGLPDCYILRNDASLEPIVSNALALGILAPDAFEVESQRYNLTQGDKVYLLSDGLLETENTHGEQYGEDRFQSAIASAQSHEAKNDCAEDSAFGSIKQDVISFIGAQSRADDISLVEIEVVSAQSFSAMYAKSAQKKAQQPASWSISYEFRVDSLRNQDPVPLILHSLLEEPNLRQYSGQLFSIISELYNNALEHGLLNLSSAIKEQEQGFAKYYDLRVKRLQGLSDGFVRFDIDCRATSDSGELCVEVIDSGEGFDYGEHNKQTKEQAALHGRGISLLHTICQKVEYVGKGNHVRVEYNW
ncbi:MAG: SpoIIE family protein phosphatase [Pseudomonadales bacterium]|nr:SpoIIE family protein phosphatase [Pseudomonadales bacterium]